MAHEASGTVEREQRLDEVIGAYLEAAGDGAAPDRQALLQAHPDLACELAEFFAEQDRLERLAAPLRNAVMAAGPLAASEANVPCPGLLGDFRLVREIGRGGMGIVYEAEQVSLRRRVAVKVLPFAGALDERLLQRFRNEAQAAAGLHHTNIVPVYFVGSERGVHFFAMQLIEGQTLASVLGELRQQAGRPDPAAPGVAETAAAGLSTEGPTRGKQYFQAVARLGVQAAEALEHAHQRGIIHRDIKPGNLLLDARGNLWLTDFGLAHLQHAETSLTVTGDLVGTLRYMSPEQALGKRIPVDQRTDVYSLGATLYELLTLRPAFTGRDRQELLQQVAFEEPTALRKLDRSIPAELETIVLKAMEKNPADRYAGAAELADDLRRFLDDRPIQARRPTLAKRLEKWLWRHRTLAVSVLLGLFLAVVALAVSVVWVWNEKEKTSRAYDSARIEKENAEREQKRAEASLDRALEAIDRMLTRVGFERLAKEPRMEKLRRALLEEALDLCQGLFRDNPDREKVRFRLGAVYRRVGRIRLLLGQPKEAAAAFAEGEALLGKGLDETPDHLATRLELARLHHSWGALLLETGELDECEKRMRQAIDLLERADAAVPRTDLFVEVLAQAYNGLGTVYQKKNQLAEAGRAYQRAIDTLRPRVADGTANDTMLNFLGNCLNNLAITLQGDRAGRQRGCRLLEEAIVHQRAALKRRPDSLMYRLCLRDDLENLALFQEQLGLRDQATKTLAEIIPLGEQFAAEFPNIPKYRSDLFGTYFNQGSFLSHGGKLKEAETLYGRALVIGEKLVKDFPALTTFRRDLALGYVNMAELMGKARRPADREKAYQRAIELIEGIGAGKLTAADRRELATAYSNLGDLAARGNQKEKAVAAYRKAIKLNPEDAEAYYNLGLTLGAQRKLAEAEAAYRKAIALRLDYPEAHCNLGNTLRGQGRFVDSLAAYRRGHEIGSRKSGWRYPSEQWVRSAERLVAIEARLPNVLSGQARPADVGEMITMAMMCALYKNRYADATRLYKEAFAADPKLARAHRYNAARAAALAGCGKGERGHRLPEQQRLQWRKQALDWLAAHLNGWNRVLDREPDRIRPILSQEMRNWQADSDLAGVREPQALAKLPEEERLAWQKLWADVADTLARAKAKTAPSGKAKPK